MTGTRAGRLLAIVLILATRSTATAADQWSELKTPHFTVISNASDGNTRSIAWQLEQVRSAMVNLAFVLARLRKYDEAAVQAQAAQRLATTDSERQRAKELVDLIAKARAGGSE
jgi:hypothetical protein